MRILPDDPPVSIRPLGIVLWLVFGIPLLWLSLSFFRIDNWPWLLFVLDLTAFLFFIDSRRVAIWSAILAHAVLALLVLYILFTEEGEGRMVLMFFPVAACVLLFHAFVARFVSGLFHEPWTVALKCAALIAVLAIAFWFCLFGVLGVLGYLFPSLPLR